MTWRTIVDRLRARWSRRTPPAPPTFRPQQAPPSPSFLHNARASRAWQRMMPTRRRPSS
jgi:hypothetical protein